MAEPTVADFASLEIRVAQIIDVDHFPEARKPAWKLTLDFGPLGIRRSSAQIANYAREELIGRPVVAVTNIGTRRIADFTSECLVLASIGGDGVPVLLAAGPAAHPGDRVS